MRSERRLFRFLPILLVLGAVSGIRPFHASDDQRLGQAVVPTFESVKLTIDAAKPDFSGAARIELQVVFSQLIARFPTLRLAVDAAELTMRGDVLTGGLVALPVRW